MRLFCFYDLEKCLFKIILKLTIKKAPAVLLFNTLFYLFCFYNRYKE